MPFVVGESVGPYRILAQLGQGGMATVFKAYHASLDRYVAIKVMHPAFLTDPNFLARFQREAQVVAKLDHPNLVPIYDFSEHRGHPYLVMKYIPGQTLKARLGQGPLPKEEILRIVRAVGAGLDFAHRRGILHRDIKPSNVLLVEGGQVYLTDFGLARMAQAGQSTLSSDVMLGTPQYISPEQAMGKGELDEGTDIYSFGVMMYEMVVGRVPFSADTPYSIIHDHIYTPLPLPSSFNPDISEALERVLLKALAKDRADRYPDVSSLVGEFERALEAEEVEGPRVLADEGTRGADVPVTPVAPGSQTGPEVEIGGRPATVEGETGPSAELEKGKPRWRRWWLAVPLLGVLCICALLGVGAMSEQFGEASEQTASPAALETAFSSPTSPVITQSGNLDSALQLVEQNPDDPYAYVELAVAYWEIGDMAEAQVSLERAGEVAGEGPEFYGTAGDLLAEREAWLLAAAAYLKLAASYPGGRPPVEVRERLGLAIYLAAQDARARALFASRDRFPGLELMIMETARARFQLYLGNAQIAQSAVDDLLQRAPNYAPAQLLQAEIHLHAGDAGASMPLLERLAQSETEPQWVGAIAEILLAEINR